MIIIYTYLRYLPRIIDLFKAWINKGYICSIYDIHKSVGIKSITWIYGEGRITIKKGTYIGTNSYIVAHPKSAIIKIGRNCMISHEVHIRTSQYDISTLHLPMDERKSIYADISIGNNVWIGKGVFIKGGVIIGDNAVIGANSVVTKDIESNTIVGGIPAKVIRSR